MKKKLFSLLFAAVLCSNVTAFGATDYVEIGSLRVETVMSDGVFLIPIRKVAEALDYKVDWTAETKTVALTKLPQYVKFTVGIDGYTFARTAPIELGTAPVIIDGYTYVPVEVLTDVMGIESDIVDNVLVVKQDEVVNTAVVTAVEGNSITVEDDVKGEVVLALNDDTKITDADGNEVDEIIEGMTVEVVYGSEMTMSIPPVNNPVSVTVK